MLTIQIELYRESFHGLRDTGEPDWPPSPRRLLGALIAGAHSLSTDNPNFDLALNTLRRLAATPPPIIDAPQAISLGLPPTYSPVTWLPDEKSPNGIRRFLDFSMVGMDTVSRALKPQEGVALASRLITFYIGLECDKSEIAALHAAARRVPYFGTSKDPADLGVTSIDSLSSTPGPQMERWYPDRSLTGPSHSWQPNTIEWLEANYQRIFGQDETISQLPPIPPTGFVLTLAYTKGTPAAPNNFPIARLTKSVPNNRIPSLMRQLNTSLASELPDGRVFPLTVSHENQQARRHGDGRCVGFGLISDAPDTDTPARQDKAQTILAKSIALLPEEKTGLIVGDSETLKPGTWVGPSTTWYSTTPLRAFPDERVVRYQLAEELNERYGVQLDRLVLQREPRIRRNGRWSNDDLADGLTQWWGELTLSSEVSGPLLLGAVTDRGFGMFRPRRRSA